MDPVILSDGLSYAREAAAGLGRAAEGARPNMVIRQLVRELLDMSGVRY